MKDSNVNKYEWKAGPEGQQRVFNITEDATGFVLEFQDPTSPETGKVLHIPFGYECGCRTTAKPGMDLYADAKCGGGEIGFEMATWALWGPDLPGLRVLNPGSG